MTVVSVKVVQEQYPTLNVSLVATTGAAASRLKGAKTLAAWLQVGGQAMKLDKFDEILNAVKQTKPVKLKTTDLLIIDEVSMLSQTQFENLNKLLSNYREDPDPFGGILVVFVGDPFQLPPVPHDGGAGYYRNQKIFVPSCLEQSYPGFKYCVANQMMRSKEDKALQNILLGLISSNPNHRELALSKINEACYIELLTPEESVQMALKTGQTILTPVKIGENSVAHYNRIAKEIAEEDPNYQEFTPPPPRKLHNDTTDLSKFKDLFGGDAGLRIEEHTMEDRDSWFKAGCMLRTGQNYSIRANFKTKEGFSVCNGDTGTLKSFNKETNEAILYLPRFKKEVTIPYREFKSEWEDNIGYSGLPLIEATAMTFHKAQGATLPNGVIVDLDRIYHNEYLAHGIYTVMSRVKKLADIRLTCYVMPSMLSEHPAIGSKVSYIWKLRYMKDYPKPDWD